ncbi:MAG: c-type cytochrome [Deltaproteobacteria bacterium]|nr:c-type cytochrome [Deltaproteobacteria bacterium]
MRGFSWADAPLLCFGIRTILLSIPFAIAGCSGPQATAQVSSAPDPDPMLAEVGAELFTSYCASCHGVDARGGGPAAPALITPPSDLSRIAARGGGVFPESSVARLIDGRFDLPAHGSREMPIWGACLAEEIPCFATGDEVARGRIASLVEYLKSVQRP